MKKLLLNKINEVLSTKLEEVENPNKSLTENATYFKFRDTNYCIERLETEESELAHYYITLADDSTMVAYVKETI